MKKLSIAILMTLGAAAASAQTYDNTQRTQRSNSATQQLQPTGPSMGGGESGNGEVGGMPKNQRDPLNRPADGASGSSGTTGSSGSSSTYNSSGSSDSSNVQTSPDSTSGDRYNTPQQKSEKVGPGNSSTNQ